MRSLRGAIGRAILLGAVVLPAGCGRGQHGGQQPAPILEVALGIKNNSFFDVDVFALPSVVSTRVRIGHVVGFQSAAFVVPARALRPGGGLVLYVHAIGSTRYWISPELAVSSDVQACLQIYADPSGDLSRSMFYSQQAPEPDERAGRAAVCSTITSSSPARAQLR